MIMSKFGLWKFTQLLFITVFLISLVILITVCTYPVTVWARPAHGESHADIQSPWYRLQNREVQIDFLASSNYLPGSVVQKNPNIQWAESSAQGALFLDDRLNGVSVRTASSSFEVWENNQSEAFALHTIQIGDPTSGGFTMNKIYRLLPEGALLEVKYDITNTSPVAQELQYEVCIPWNPMETSQTTRYHIPLQAEIRRFLASEVNEPITFNKTDLLESWLSIENIERGLTGFFTSKTAFESIRFEPMDGNSLCLVAVTLRSIKLLPGETLKGSYSIALYEDLGLPLTADSSCAVGVVWNFQPAGAWYELETRAIAMTEPLREFRLFSSVNDMGGHVKRTPEYVRRARLSHVNAEKVHLPKVTRADQYELEQSLYSGSTLHRYWKLILATPCPVCVLPGATSPIPFSGPRLAEESEIDNIPEPGLPASVPFTSLSSSNPITDQPLETELNGAVDDPFVDPWLTEPAPLDPLTPTTNDVQAVPASTAPAKPTQPDWKSPEIPEEEAEAIMQSEVVSILDSVM
jgi:hypothetical protein